MTRLCSCIPRWPLIVVALCLLVLSFLAPRYWQKRPQLIATLPPAADAPQVSQESGTLQISPAPTMSEGFEVTRPTPTPVASSTTIRKRNQVAAERSATNLQALEEIAAPRKTAAVLPPVAERIVLDPSIAETPPVPAPYEAPLANKVQLSQEERERIEQENHDRAVADARRELLRRSEMPAQSTIWPYPTQLIETLKSFRNDDAAGRWASYLIGAFEHLKRADSLSDPEVGVVLQKLRLLSKLPDNLAEEVPDFDARTKLLRISYAMTRRLAVWDEVFSLASKPAAPTAVVIDPKGLQRLLKAADERLVAVGNPVAWRDYLLMGDAHRLTSDKSGSVDSDRLRILARRILLRMDAPSLSEHQFDFFREPPFPQLELELRRWANEPVDYRKLLMDIERYEISQNTADSQRVADYYQILRWSPDHQVAKLAQQLNTHYRNANVRVAVSNELINQLLPETKTTQEEVNDVILGAQVTGRSTAATRLGVVLVPDRRQWRFGLFANGQAYSDTESYKSGALFRNDGWANFQARKMVMVDRRGVRVGHAETDASVQSNLRDMETDYDRIPFINRIARSIAENQYNEQSESAQSEMKGRVETQASARFDQEVQRSLVNAEKQYNTRLLRPLQELGLQPTAVDMETTESRLIVRERLAGKEQLGAHTPRPQAPGQSWLSIQMHETALNNALAHMGLDGKRSDLPHLYRELADRFDQQGTKVPEDLPDDVIVHFAKDDSVRVRFEGGRVTLIIRIAELSQGNSVLFKNFVVRAHYKPLADQSVANLQRDGVIELVGERLGFGDQVKLRGVFSKILARDGQISILNKLLKDNPRVSNLAVSQFVVEDGWIGVALEPKGVSVSKTQGSQTK